MPVAEIASYEDALVHSKSAQRQMFPTIQLTVLRGLTCLDVDNIYKKIP